MNLTAIFFNEKGRLRSGWRAALFTTFFFVLLSVITVAALSLLTALPLGFKLQSLESLTVSYGISAILAVVLGWLFGKYLDDVPFRALGAHFTENWLKHLSLGLFTGAATVCFAGLIAYVFGGLSFDVNQSANSAVARTLAVSLVIFIVGAAFEEAFFRGYIFQTLTRAKYVLAAVVFTSVFFATVHNSNPAAGVFSWFNTFLAGIWFAAAYLKTRTLWMPFGIHLMWNWFLGSILGIQVSGLTDLAPEPVLRATNAGPAWLTGGDYGLEGGLAATIALLISTLLVWFLPFTKPSKEMLELTNAEREAVPPVRRV